MSSTASIEELVVSKYLVESSTLNFTRYFFKHQYGKRFVVGNHHRQIGEHLDKVISGEIKRLIINMPPRYGKTEQAVKNFMANGLAINPEARFIHLSYSDDLALDNSEGVKDIINLEEYKQLFPNVRIKPGSDSKKKWYTTKGGGVYATSAAGQVTGFGAGRVDDVDDFDFIEAGKGRFSGALIIDDPIKPEEADSDTVRTRINNRWDSTIKNRVNSRNTPIIVIMQRLHPEDFVGYLLAQSPEEWTVLTLPAIQTDEEGKESALWEFKQTLTELYKLRKENEIVFDRQYMQNPQPLEGILFHKKDLKRYKRSDFKEDGLQGTLGYIDVADEGDDSFSFPVGKAFKRKVFITDVIHSKDGIDLTEPLAIALIEKTKCELVRVEANNQGGMLIRTMRKKVSPEKIMPVKNTSNKHTRILLAAGFIKEYFYFLDESEYEQGSDYDKFMKEILGYMKNGTSKHDDAPDAISGLAKLFQGFLPHLFEGL